MLETIAEDLAPAEENTAAELSKDDLFSESTFSIILEQKDGYTQEKLLNQCRDRAKELKCLRQFNTLFYSYKRSIKNDSRIGMGTGVSHFPPGRAVIKTGKWTANANGVFTVRSLPNGDDTEEYASTIPILPSALLVNADTGIKKVELSFYDKCWKSAIFDASVISSNSSIIRTSDYGIEANSSNANLLVKYLADCISLNRDTIPERMSISHMGWHGSEFIPYTDGVVFDGEQDYKPIYDAVCTKGSFEEWKKYVRNLRKNIYLRLQMGAAFASPLLSRIGALPFVLHLWGGTEAGKSVGLMVSMSIWGNPAFGKMVRTMNMTINSTMTTAAMLRDIPFAGDELQIIKEQGGNYDRLIMSVCEGVDRGRMKFDKVNEMKTWNCAFLFTGEEPVTRSSSGGGAKNRVIEIECKGKVIENGRETAEFVRNNYGHAGREFIKYINDNAEEIERLYGCYVKALEEIDCTDKQRLSMAAILLGDAIGSSLFFSGETPLSPEDVQPFLKTRAEVDVAARAFEYIKDIIALNDNRFNSNSSGDMSGEIWGRMESTIVGKEPDQWEYVHVYINKTKLVDILREAGYEFDAVKSKWAENKSLTRNSQGKMIHQTKCNGAKGNYVLLNMVFKVENGNRTTKK
jgi:hypothetical protein